MPGKLSRAKVSVGVAGLALLSLAAWRVRRGLAVLEAIERERPDDDLVAGDERPG